MKKFKIFPSKLHSHDGFKKICNSQTHWHKSTSSPTRMVSRQHAWEEEKHFTVFRKALSHFFENFPSCPLNMWVCMWKNSTDSGKNKAESGRRNWAKKRKRIFPWRKFYFRLFSYHQKIFTSFSPSFLLLRMCLCLCI